MAVVPRAAILPSSPRISKVIARSDRALRDAWYAICLHRVELTNPVPMDSSAIEIQAIDDLDVDGLQPGQYAPVTS